MKKTQLADEHLVADDWPEGLPGSLLASYDVSALLEAVETDQALTAITALETGFFSDQRDQSLGASVSDSPVLATTAMEAARGYGRRHRGLSRRHASDFQT